MITATESIALRWRVIGAHGAVVRYALDCNWCGRPLFVRDYYGFLAGESETCACGTLNYVHLNEHGEPLACMEENCAECDGTGVSRERGRIVCRPCRGTGAALPSTTDALAERGGG